MKLKDIEKGMLVFVSKPDHPFKGEEGKVLSIYKDYGLNSDLISIRLLLEGGGVISGLQPEDLSP